MIRTRRNGADAAAFDVAGVPIAIVADDEDRLRLGALALSGAIATDRAPVATVVIDARPTAAPAGPPRDELMGVRLWVHDGGITMAAGGVVGTVADGRISLHVPRLEDAPSAEAVASALLGWLLAGHDRFVVHGGAVARGGRALLVLGGSGAGKSTLVAAAIEHGWQALSDDLVVLEAVGGEVRVHGLHRAPAVPMEIGGPVVDAGTPLEGSRHRAELSRDVLTAGGFGLESTVLAAHAPGPRGELDAIGPLQVLPLLMQSFAGMIDAERRARFFAFTERVRGIPAWRLGHAGDAEARRAHVGAALDRVFADAAGSGPVSDRAR